MKNTLTAAVLLIGNELLSGRVQDVNLSHIAGTLEQHGIRIREARVVADVEGDIITALNACRKKYDYVFTTGGIGPTHDDITSDCIAKAFGVSNVIRQKSNAALQHYFEQKGIQFTEAAARMAYAPEGAQLYNNMEGIPQGYRIENVFVLAGVPSIMRNILACMIEHLDTGLTIVTSTIQTTASESEIAKPLMLIQQRHDSVDIGSYPQDPQNSQSGHSVVLVVKGTDKTEVHDICQQIKLACHDSGHEAELI